MVLAIAVAIPQNVGHFVRNGRRFAEKERDVTHIQTYPVINCPSFRARVRRVRCQRLRELHDRGGAHARVHGRDTVARCERRKIGFGGHHQPVAVSRVSDGAAFGRWIWAAVVVEFVARATV